VAANASDHTVDVLIPGSSRCPLGKGWACRKELSELSGQSGIRGQKTRIGRRNKSIHCGLADFEISCF